MSIVRSSNSRKAAFVKTVTDCVFPHAKAVPGCDLSHTKAVPGCDLSHTKAVLAAKAVLERIALFLSHNTLIKHANESAEQELNINQPLNGMEMISLVLMG